MAIYASILDAWNAVTNNANATDRVRVDASGVSLTVSGTVTTNQGTNPWTNEEKVYANSGSISALNQTVVLSGNNFSTASLTVTGIWSGTITFEESNDGGVTWFATYGLPDTGAITQSIAANGNFHFSVGGQTIRVRASVWTSGTANIVWNGKPAPNVVEIISSNAVNCAVTAFQGTPPWSQNLTQVSGTAISATNPVPSRITDGTGNIGSTVYGSTRYLNTAIIQSDIVSGNNSSTANLGPSATFTGTSDSSVGYSVIFVSFIADQNCTVQIQQSPDNTNWDITDAWTTQANTGDSRPIELVASYVRVVVSNNSATTATTFLRLQSTYMATSEVLPRALSASGNLKVSLEENHAGITITSPINDVTNAISGTITANGQTVQFLNTGYSTLIVNISATWVGTLSFYGTPDAGTLVPVNGRAVGTSAVATSTTTNNTYQFNIAGFNTFTIKSTAWTSGTALLVGEASAYTRDETLQVNTESPSATVAGVLTNRQTALSNTAVAVKASAGRVYGYHIANTGSTDAFVHFYDVAQGSVTVGTTTPKESLYLPAGGVIDDFSSSINVEFDTAITIAASTTATGGTAPGTALLMNTRYV